MSPSDRRRRERDHDHRDPEPDQGQREHDAEPPVHSGLAPVPGGVRCQAPAQNCDNFHEAAASQRRCERAVADGHVRCQAP